MTKSITAIHGGSMVKAFKDSEKQIENAILTWLNYQPGVFAFKVNTGGIYDQTKGIYRRTSKFIVKGTADIIAAVSNPDLGSLSVAAFLALEVKTNIGRQSDHQKVFQYRVEKAKGLYFVVRSIEDAEAAVKHARTYSRPIASAGTLRLETQV